jgi:hypothetical protein
MPRFRFAQKCDVDPIALIHFTFDRHCRQSSIPHHCFFQSRRSQFFNYLSHAQHCFAPLLTNYNDKPSTAAKADAVGVPIFISCRAAFSSEYWARVSSFPWTLALQVFVGTTEYEPSIPGHEAVSEYGGNPPHLTSAQSMRQCKASTVDNAVAARRVCTLSAPVATGTPRLR